MSRCAFSGVGFIALRRDATHPELWTVALIALVASFVAGAVQEKGWGYHFYPARAFALFLLALAVLDIRRPLPRPVRRVYWAVASAAVGTSVIWAIAVGVMRLTHHDSALCSKRPSSTTW